MNLNLSWIVPLISWAVTITIVYMFVKVLWRLLNKLGKPNLNFKVPTLHKKREQLLFYTQNPENISIGMELDGHRVIRISEIEPQILVDGKKSRTWEIWGKPIT